MTNIVEDILKNEIEILKTKYLHDGPKSLSASVAASVLEERIKELPVSDQAYFTLHNIQLAMMDEFNKKLDLHVEDGRMWDRRWAIENALKWVEMQKGQNLKLTEIADGLMEYIYKDSK